MPTPFYHLALAFEMRAQSSFPALLRQEWPAFCFGTIAPDAQTISGQTRTATHFFDVPMLDRAPAWEAMFAAHPGLAAPRALPAAQAAFVAGYICHLALDQLWIADIFEPVFGPDAPGHDFRHRLFLHNVLRIYLDRLDLPALQTERMGATLKQAAPRRWLPFLADGDLYRWRDFVAGQLTNGGESQTVEVFAARMGLTRADFESLLQSPAHMQTGIFDRLPLESLAQFRARGRQRCLAVAARYLAGPR